MPALLVVIGALCFLGLITDLLKADYLSMVGVTFSSSSLTVLKGEEVSFELEA
jgi:hypothetical protein